MLTIEQDDLRNALNVVCDVARREGGLALVVGGCVRDSLLGHPAKDIDVEVYGVEPVVLKNRLAALFRIDLVGDAFGVIKLHGLNMDISIPRRESKAGLGHKGFEILSDPNMTVEEAASRRDFTINSMAYDPKNDRLFDYYGGERDLRERVLRHTSAKFAEDPLRVLRGMQFAARFDLDAAQETINICNQIELENIAGERVFEEWTKLILLGVTPSRGLEFLRQSTWIRYFPELNALIGCEQEQEWHPEGDVWMHTLCCMDAFAKERVGDSREDLAVGFAVLCHDFGKPGTTRLENGRLRSPGHEPAGGEPTRAFLSRMTNQQELVKAVVLLVAEHLKPLELFEAKCGDSAIRRLAWRVGRIDQLVRVARADQKGRHPSVFQGFPAGDWLLARAEALKIADNAPNPLVMGRHLIQIGLTPSPAFGSILRACYDAQIDGAFFTVEGGVDFAKGVAKNQASEER